MEPRSPEDGVTSLVGLPSRDMIYAAGFGLGRSDGMVAASRRGDGVWAATALGAPPGTSHGAGSSAQESYTDPTTPFVSSVVDIVRLKFPHKNCSQAVQSFQSESGS